MDRLTSRSRGGAPLSRVNLDDPISAVFPFWQDELDFTFVRVEQQDQFGPNAVFPLEVVTRQPQADSRCTRILPLLWCLLPGGPRTRPLYRCRDRPGPWWTHRGEVRSGRNPVHVPDANQVGAVHPMIRRSDPGCEPIHGLGCHATIRPVASRIGRGFQGTAAAGQGGGSSSSSSQKFHRDFRRSSALLSKCLLSADPMPNVV